MIELINNIIPKLTFTFPLTAEEWAEQSYDVENYHKHTDWSNVRQIDSTTSILRDFLPKTQERHGLLYFSGEHGYQGNWLYCYDLCRQTEDEGFRSKNNLKQPFKFRYSTEAYWVKDRFADDNTNCHIVLVARTYNGIRKLNYILSEANESGFYYKPRIDLELLFTLDPEDVYVTSACVAGWKYEDAEEIWIKIFKHFRDSFFLEYQTHNTEKQVELNKKIQRLAKEYGIQTIIGLDTHGVDDFDLHKRDNLLHRKGLFYDDEVGWYLDWPDGQEIIRRMREQGVCSDEEILYSMMNCFVFRDGCEDIEINTDFKIPIVKGYEDLTYSERTERLKKILNAEYMKEDREHRNREHIEALRYEVSEIEGSGTVDYFATNYEIMKLATSPEYGGILTTTSRGSAASYYTSKLLGFTTMDRMEAEVPIFPERFITKDRVLKSHSMPDIDMNLSNQEPFLKASRDLLGEHSCYPLWAVGKYGEKSGFKMYAGIADIEPEIANETSKLLDKYNEAKKQADDDEKDGISVEDYIKDKNLLNIFNESKPYQDIVIQSNPHPCGHLVFNGDHLNKDIIGYGDIRYEFGLFRCQSETGKKKSVLVACVEGALLDKYGYVKNDYLIVDVVGIIHKLYAAIGRNVPTVNELRKMVKDDDLVWNLYANGVTCSLNQCEKTGTISKVKIYKPKNVKELAAFIAAIRPGFKSLLKGFLNRTEYSNGEKAIDDILQDSFHYMLYQEAVMKIFSYLGIDMKESYDTIKKISKKKLVGEALARTESNLKEHWLKNIGNLDNFERIYNVVKDSARYSFNAPHALAMAFDSLYEAWMKAHYTSVFYEVTLNHYQQKNDKDKVALLMEEAKKYFGYQPGRYEYGADNSKVVVDEKTKTIYPDLASVKGIGRQAVLAMMDIANRNYSDFVDVYLAIKGTKVNSTVFTNLVKIGYFHRFGTVLSLMKKIDICDKWRGKSTIAKKDIYDLGLDGIDLSMFATDVLKSGKHSETRWSNLNWYELIKYLCSKIDTEEEYTPIQLLKMEYKVLGYVNRVDPSFDPRYVLVTKLDNKYSPKFIAVRIKDGKAAAMKVHKKRNGRDKRIVVSYQQAPFEDGDILFIKDTKREAKRQNVGGEWVSVPNENEWWIKDYIVVN